MRNLILGISLSLFSATFATGQELIDESLRREANLALRGAIQYLESSQQADGSWDHYPAITGLVLGGMLKSPVGITEATSGSVKSGISFILSKQQTDGGFYVDDQKAYTTSICLIALAATRNPAYTEAIRRGRDFLIRLQLDEEEGKSPDSIYYGGIGYNGQGKTDLSNTAWALEALKETASYRKVPENTGKTQEYSAEKTAAQSSNPKSSNHELFWDKAITFLTRCQNVAANDRPWKSDDGGFVYSPSESKAGSYTSYGSMTYAGMKSMIYANLKKDDSRVQAALGWLRKNYTFEANPGMGVQGIYYYYLTMAKALAAVGESTFVDDQGVKHNWRKEYISKLLTIKSGEGFWVNQNGRWWETNKNLVTSYILLGMSEALQVQ